MIYKLLAPFQSNFHLVSESLILDSAGYMNFWNSVVKKDQINSSIKKIDLKSGEFIFRFPHHEKYHKPHSNRYSTLEHNSLERPLHLLEIQLNKIDEKSKQEIIKLLQDKNYHHVRKITKIRETEKIEAIENVVRQLLDSKPVIIFRIFDHGVSLLEAKFKLGSDWWNNDKRINDQEGVLKAKLSDLQFGGIILGEMLANHYADKMLYPVFNWLRKFSKENGYNFVDEVNEALTGEEYNGKVLWVTRTLIFEPGSRMNKKIKNTIIEQWLKDSVLEADENKNLIENVKEDPEAHQVNWLNYLFRENSYQEMTTLAEDDPQLSPPFCDEWEAMLYAQYFYSAMDVVDQELKRILAMSLSENPRLQIKDMKKLLEQNLRNANLLLIQFYDSSKYYKRTVKAKMDKILENWNFEKVLVKQVQEKIKLCNERFDVLIKKEAAKASTNREIIIMAFSITAIFGMGLSLAQYGRTMAADANLARFDIKSSNYIDYFAGQPTDVILLFSTAISMLLVAMYLFFRKRQAT